MEMTIYPELGSEEDEAYERFKTRWFLERGEKSSQGMLARVKEGWFAGPAPLGYRNGEWRHEPPIMVDEQTAPLVKEAFEMAASGLKLGDILRRLRVKGLRGKHGNPLTSRSLELILNNPFYYGQIRYHGRLYPGKHPAVITKELYDNVQAKLIVTIMW